MDGRALACELEEELPFEVWEYESVFLQCRGRVGRFFARVCLDLVVSWLCCRDSCGSEAWALSLLLLECLGCDFYRYRQDLSWLIGPCLALSAVDFDQY